MNNRTLNDFSARTLSRRALSSSALQAPSTRFREDLGTLRNRASFTDEVTKDEDNTYRFRLRRNTTLEVSLENLEELNLGELFGTKRRVQATLFSSGGSSIRSTDRIRPDDDDDFRVRLNPGTYSVRIRGRSEREVEYRLRLRTSNSNNFDDDD